MTKEKIMHLIILVIQNPSISQNNKLYRRNYSNDVRPMYTYIIFVMLCIFINARFQNYLKSSNFNSYKDTQWLLMNQRESENKCYMFRQVKRLSHLPGCLSDWQDENGDYVLVQHTGFSSPVAFLAAAARSNLNS